MKNYQRLEVSPFGDVMPRPVCPRCGQSLSWWATVNMNHIKYCNALKGSCIEIPADLKAKLEEALEA